MIFAVVADVHSNLEALAAVVEHARRNGAERFVFLGDLVGYGADPEPVVERIMQLAFENAVVLQGNHDAAVAQRDAGGMNDEAKAAIVWTRAQLKPRHVEFLFNLPLIQREQDITWVHASAAAPELWTYVNSAHEARRSLDAAGTPYVFSGHVHDPMLYYTGRDEHVAALKPSEEFPIPVSSNRSWLAITGSAGQPRDGMVGARYVLFDHTLKRLTFHRVAYDYTTAAAKIRAAGLSERFAQLVEGRDY
ncbi:MAG TPA: metallophosphoesterase [Rhodocyclaceae bacterium]|nr:metallophosphoesterase [Rhodocyclaceae bacterium]